MLISCTAIKKDGKKCTTLVINKELLCHIHKPNGKFQKHLKGESVCSHRYYMRDLGITCIDCGDIWKPDER